MQSWKLISKLVLSQLAHHPGRAVVTVVGVIASTCAVVWVVSGYDALVSQFDENAEKYLGRYDALIIPTGPPGAFAVVDDNAVEALKNDPGVLELNPVTQSRVTVTRVAQPDDEPEPDSALGLLIGTRPPVHGAPPIDPLLVGTPAVNPPYELQEGKWLDEDADAAAAVLGIQTARRLKIKVGDRILVTSVANQLEIPVVGLVDQASQSPSLGGPGRSGPRKGPSSTGGDKGKGNRSAAGRPDQPKPSAADSVEVKQAKLALPSAFVQGVATNAVYVRPAVAEKINGFASQPTVLQVALRDTVTTAEFAEAWQPQFEAAKPPLRFIDFTTVRGGIERTRSVSSQRSQAWAATGMAALAAIFIILSTLSMGVTERSREFAVLRTVGLTRSQVAGVIAFESVVLAVVGWLGGMLAGAALLMLGSRVLPGLFSSGVGIGWTTIALSGLTVLAGALGAAILPMWRVMRIKPLEAMAKQTDAPQARPWAVMGVVGMCLAAIAPLIVFVLPVAADWRTFSYSFIAYPALLLGMALMAPMMILACERWFAPLISRLLRLDERLMKSQLSSNMWRTIGATLALSVGLGLYASTQTWGYSMLQPFLPGDWVPDGLVAFHPVGLDDDGLAKVQAVQGVKSDEVLPVTIEQPRIAWPDGEGPSTLRYDNALLFGIDPSRAIGGEDPMMKFDFVDGERDAVAKELADGGACVISEDFQMLTGISVGDEMHFEPPNEPDKVVTYRVAGVVSLPGWHWVTKFSGVRRHHVRTATMIFVDRDAVRKDFHLPQTEFYWFNTAESASLAVIESGMQKIAEDFAGTSVEAQGFGTMTSYRPFARVTATDTVRKAITLHADATINGMSYLPLVTLIIMSLAVANAMIAAVRSRTWEFGVMRSIGLSRGQLVRLIIAETILIGVAACLLSLTFGLIGGWSGVGMARYGGGFFAGTPSFLVPWTQLAFGFGLTLLLCLLAGIWPALKTGRAKPLELLQAGRGRF